MAVGPRAVVAAVLNRPGSLGPVTGKRSRGELPLLAAAQPDAVTAAAAVADLDGTAWRPFNMIVADPIHAFFLRGIGAGRPETMPIGDGITMVTARDPNDCESPRTDRHLPRFRAAAPPDPEAGDWQSWSALLADDSVGRSAADALRVPPAGGFGTVSSSLVALGSDGTIRWLFAPVRDGEPVRYAPVTPPGA